MDTLYIAKIGGNIVNDSEQLEIFLDEFASLDHPKILVHGGGSSASDMCKKLDIPIQMKEGRRITDAPALDVAVMVYAGLINKNIVAKFQGRSADSLGLSGADLNIIPAKKRSRTEIDYGFVGDINAETINTYFLGRLLDEQIIPVISAITHDNNGQLLNTNADTIASTLAVALCESYNIELTYCFEKAGVMQDMDDDSSLIDLLTKESFASLKAEGVIKDGMIPKLDTAFEALSRNVQNVHIKHSKNLSNQTGTELSL
jgi:acetylglutamate kinase